MGSGFGSRGWGPGEKGGEGALRGGTRLAPSGVGSGLISLCRPCIRVCRRVCSRVCVKDWASCFGSGGREPGEGFALGSGFALPGGIALRSGGRDGCGRGSRSGNACKKGNQFFGASTIWVRCESIPEGGDITAHSMSRSFPARPGPCPFGRVPAASHSAAAASCHARGNPTDAWTTEGQSRRQKRPNWYENVEKMRCVCPIAANPPAPAKPRVREANCQTAPSLHVRPVVGVSGAGVMSPSGLWAAGRTGKSRCPEIPPGSAKTRPQVGGRLRKTAKYCGLSRADRGPEQPRGAILPTGVGRAPRRAAGEAPRGAGDSPRRAPRRGRDAEGFDRCGARGRFRGRCPLPSAREPQNGPIIVA